MATREHLQKSVEREIRLTVGETGVGIFGLTPDYPLDPVLSYGFDRTFQFDEFGDRPSRTDLQRNIDNGQSFMIHHSRPGSALERADDPDGIDELLPDGYRKYFVLDVTKPAFEAKMWRISGQIKLLGDDLPDPEAHGFLGAAWFEGLSKGELLGAATRRCIHPCNPPRQCIEIGCFCNHKLHSCV